MPAKRIPLTRSKFAVVDADDYELLKGLKWQAHFDPKCNKWYARHMFKKNGKIGAIIMHR